MDERKVVTAVFADVVGSTELAERLDPEQVAALLGGFWHRTRDELVRRGGVVEKYVGDAVVGLFGVPAGHEDDALRAVEAALAIRDGADRPLRIGVATGEALVRLDARPEAGETAAVGDVMNTAARLQEAAPVDAILVDAATHDATCDRVAYTGVPAVVAKGKTQPVRAWRVDGLRAGVTAHAATPFVGREPELALLAASFRRAVDMRTPQLVTILGPPGIGKTRLAEELRGRLGDEARWLHGRTPPYDVGGGPMAALAEAILDGDEPAAALAKLEPLLVRLPGTASRVRSLLGLAAAPAELRDERVETFGAWRRLLEALAAQRPLVVALDDLQWSDEVLLDFVEHLVDWSAGSPLLVVGTARSELHDRHPDWGAGKGNAITLTLGPLADAETAQLLASLLEQPAADVPAQLRRRVGGNPLYAEQFGRMLAEGGAADAVPRSVQAVIGARLDALLPEEKRVVEDVAVAGDVFWPRALEIAPDAPALHGLERKNLVERRASSSIAGEAEYAFAHGLVRDAAYARLPRARRSELHVRMAEWLAAAGGEERADALARHYEAALDAARAAGAPTDGLEARARAAFVAAGDRALALNAFSAAIAYLRAALALEPRDPHALLRLGQALWIAHNEGDDELREARDLLHAAGDKEREAEAEALLCELAWYRGDLPRSWRSLDDAATLVEDALPSPGKAYVLARLSRQLMLGAHYERAIETGRDALALAERFELDELRANLLNSIGSARARAGDQDGLHDVERAAEISLAAGGYAAVVAYNNLGSLHGELGDLRTSNDYLQRARELAERLGIGSYLAWSDRELVARRLASGEWDVLAAEAPLLLGEHYLEPIVRVNLATVLQARGERERARGELERAEAAARRVGEPQVLLACLAQCALLHWFDDERAAAAAAADEVVELATASGYLPPGASFALAVVLDAEARGDELAALLDASPQQSRWFDAARAYLDGDFARAAALYGEIGDLPAQAYARLRAGDPRGAEFYASVGARAPVPA
jgi:class 3 adenylate cyclase/tetratricopeptide (TPR) repeat protein